MGFIDQLDETIEKVIDAAIDFYMSETGWERGEGGPYRNTNYRGVEIAAPGKPNRTSGGQVTCNGQPHEWYFEYGAGPNAGSLVYGHFEDTIRQLFQWWRAIPNPHDFDDYIISLTDGAWAISVTSSGSGEDTKITGVGSDVMSAALPYLLKTVTESDMNGQSIQNFAYYCFHLPTAIQGQYALCLYVAGTLAYEKKTWLKAQSDILDIADKMLAAMRARGGGETLDLATITALVEVASSLTGPAVKKVLDGVKTVIDGLGLFLNPPKPEKKTETGFEADSTDGIITKTREALAKLSHDIVRCEDDIERKSKEAIDYVLDHPGSFNIAKPAIVSETQVNGFQADLGLLSQYATSVLPDIAKQVNIASDAVTAARDSRRLWRRPVEINTGGYGHGAYETWEALVTLAEGLTADLAWEITESAKVLAIVADQTARTEEEVEASMKQHADNLGSGSGQDPIGKATDWREKHPR